MESDVAGQAVGQGPSLDDRYDLDQRQVFVGGMQAIVRLLLEQHERDRRAGLTTGGFVSGYRGSPVGRLDSELWSASRQLAPRRIHFQPGVNEELAATSVWGSQQLALTGGSDVDGVFGLWYGKGPGVDRSGDAFKHANLAGTAPRGGVLVLAGDDPAAKSSTTAHQSEQALMAAMIPVLVPADIQETLDLGLIGYAMSRFSGCWVGLKVTTPIADAGATIESSLDRLDIVVPAARDDLHVRWPDDRVGAEARLVGPKLDAVRAFARVNAIDRLVWSPPGARLGIVTSGRSHYDVIEALRQRGIDADNAAAHGIRLYKVGMSWPLEPDGARAFAEGLERILVIEEKRGLIEPQLKELLYDSATPRPAILGKRGADGTPLVAEHGELSPEQALVAIDMLLGNPVAPATPSLPPLEPLSAAMTRTEFFCAGCPHNRSTKVPAGSIALAGIGCHTMASRMPDRNTVTVCQMGGEGTAWIGQAPFSKRDHVFQNLGDGTYFHSGFLAIRAAIAAKINITYKLLMNDAVAMTGGQPIEGTLSVEAVCAELAAEGAARIVVVTDQPDLPRVLPAGVAVRDRREMEAVQRELATQKGVSILVYQQVCAAEKRRRRKRDLMPDPPKRLFINQRVCEGCGDCVKQSSCIAVAPVQTPFGRKREIDQSACNKDFSCLEGFCPSFVEIAGATPRRADRSRVDAWLRDADRPPAGPRPAGEAFRVLVTGIGGTGVVTVGAVLAMAAHLDGNRAQTLDQTGLAQKNGAVSSHVTIAAADATLGPVKIGKAQTDLLIACDAVVAAASDILPLLGAAGGVATVNEAVTPTAGQTFALSGSDDPAAFVRRIAHRMGANAIRSADAGGLARELLGDAVFANMMMLGFAWQVSRLPVSLDAMRAAIRLNGAAVEINLAAFELGRQIGANGIDALAALRPARPRDHAPETLETLETIVARQRAHLVAYQDKAYASRYAERVERVAQAERALGGGDLPLARAVAFSLARVMSYKDEYEVARLYSDGAFRAALAAQFDNVGALSLYLAPPLLSKRDPATGRPAKRAFGPWMFRAMAVLAKGKWLRGTAFDPFGRTEERRAERALLTDYQALVDEVVAGLTAERRDEAVALLTAVDDVRGYGPLKDANLAAYREWLAGALAQWRVPAATTREPVGA